MLRKYEINHDIAMTLANSRKGYWRISRSEVIHRGITKERRIKWRLRDLTALYEHRYLKGCTAKYETRTFDGVRGRHGDMPPTRFI